MRRIMSACLLQTMRFDTANDANPDQEFEMFCQKMDRNRTQYVRTRKKSRTAPWWSD